MKIVYLILGHKNPNQVYDLMEKLDHRNVSFIVHIDKKSKELWGCPFRDNVIFIDKTDCQWAHISLVEATLNIPRKDV